MRISNRGSWSRGVRVVRGAGNGSGGGGLGHQGVEVRLDRRITGDHLLLKGVEEFEVLLEDKDVLGAIVLRAAAISRSEA